ncbi:hypothetical protein MRX96_032647 [Rhipicephalus microplus]
MRIQASCCRQHPAKSAATMRVGLLFSLTVAMSMIWGAGAFPGLCIPVDYCDATCVAGYDTARMRDLRLSTLSSLSNGLLRSGGPVAPCARRYKIASSGPSLSSSKTIVGNAHSGNTGFVKFIALCAGDIFLCGFPHACSAQPFST